MPVVMSPCSGAIQIARTCDIVRPEFLIMSVGNNFDAIVTGMSLNLAANYQFMHSLDDFIYVYAFGERIGDLSFNGIGFVNACGDGADRMNIMRLYEYYNTNVSTGVVRPIDITITSSTKSANLRGVLTAVRVDVVEENGIMGHWSLNFKVIRND